ncbi:MAG: iron complex transport system substrate-binding protein [Desulforhopalus sp.]|jgi:iron complex transport system substrate-binding protein
MKILAPFVFGVLILCLAAPALATATRVITDMAGRKVQIPVTVDRVLCSGPGCLRYLTYLQGQDRIVGVDSIEKRRNPFDARPYALANPQFKAMPLFGEFRGFDSPELILGLEPQPQVIFKTYKNMGHDPDELQAQTGIPVICLSYGNLASKRQLIYDSLRLMGEVLSKQDRATKLCEFIENTITDLAHRTADIPKSDRPSCYVGGIAKKGPHGLQSTEPTYPPFSFVNANNVALPPPGQGKPLQHAQVSKEQILAWNPPIIFVDLSSTRLGEKAGAINELKNDRAYQELEAVKKGRLYLLLPYNWYAPNYGSIIADAFYVGKVLYPERFKDINPKAKANEIYTFMVGQPVFSLMDKAFIEPAFTALKLR